MKKIYQIPVLLLISTLLLANSNLQTAKQLYTNGDYGLSFQYFEAALEDEGANHEAILHFMILCSFKLKDEKRTLLVFHDLLRINANPDLNEFPPKLRDQLRGELQQYQETYLTELKSLMLQMIDSKHYKIAHQAIEKALAIDPSNFFFLQYKAIVQEKLTPLNKSDLASSSTSEAISPNEASQKDSLSEMTYIPAGDYRIGGGNTYKDWKALPETIVHTEGFYIDKYEVRNRDYQKFLKATNYKVIPYTVTDNPKTSKFNWDDKNYPPGHGNAPVTLVSVQDMQKYAKWKGKALPTPVEWEIAARGRPAFIYPWGNKWKKNTAITRETVRKSIHKNILFWPTKNVTDNTGDISNFGCFHMAGNVSELTLDNNGQAFISGGSFDRKKKCSDLRLHKKLPRPDYKSRDLGFRCVIRNAPKPHSGS